MALLNKDNKDWAKAPTKEELMHNAMFKAAVELGDYRNLFKNCTKIWSFETENGGEAIYIGAKDES